MVVGVVLVVALTAVIADFALAQPDCVCFCMKWRRRRSESCVCVVGGEGGVRVVLMERCGGCLAAAAAGTDLEGR